MSKTVSIERFNEQIFKETTLIVNLGRYIDSKGHHHDISEKVKKSISGTETIPESFSYEKALSQKLKLTKSYGNKEKDLIFSKIEITEEGTFEAARRMKNNFTEICVLSFAHGFVPCGDVIKGKEGQEQDLSRQSNLYFCLKDQKMMYDYNNKCDSKFRSHVMIYSPEVVVFFNDDYDLVHPIRVSVISAVPLDNTSIPNDKKADARRVMKNRMRKILQLAIHKNNKVIILGAFGCGGCSHKPEDVAQMFKELLVNEFYGMFFSKIVFAIKGQPKQTNTCYQAFKNTIKK